MIFALCIDASVAGTFTEGRLYLFDSERSQIRDDAGEDILIDVDAGHFLYPELVCAVVVDQFDGWRLGETVVVSEVQDDFLLVKDAGYQQAAHFQLLDLSTLKPGMVVHDINRRCWVEVHTIDRRMRLLVEGRDSYLSCFCFDFAVRNGRVADRPLLKCIDSTGRPSLTMGHTYTPLRYEDDTIVVVDDVENETAFSPDRFEFV